MNTPKNKRMIYVSPENLDFYDSLEAKSEFVNEKLKEARLKADREKVPDSIAYVKAKVEKLNNQG